MKPKAIYVTTMYRWGDKELHSYIVYAGISKLSAINKGNKERLNRGGKYEPEVVECINSKINIIFSKINE